jgi:manganese/zinc/iron transport system permease protein
MTSYQLEIQMVAVFAALACALPGVFLVLRRMSLVSDAISHSVLLGIVLAFFVVKSISSPLLIAGAAITGLVMVFLVEALQRTQLVKEDAAIGLVFPMLFSTAVILISHYASDVHIDNDAVLLGELAFVPLRRVELWGWDLGPQAAWAIGAILAINVGFIALLFKELKVTTFDPALAAALGFTPALLHYALMGIVSVTAVGAFDAVGAVLVVALMIAPPAAAYLLTDRLSTILLLSAALGAGGAVSGYWVAHWLDASIAGSIATMVGLIFVSALTLAPERGLLAARRRRERQRWEFAQTMLVIHLFNHQGLPEAHRESRVEHLADGFGWTSEFGARVVSNAERRGVVARTNGSLQLTERGRELARTAIVR